MCGIAGIIGRLDETNRAALRRMNDAIAHRGPDAEGTWVSPPDDRGWGTLLAHRRLSILDLSPAGAQPMIDPVTGHVVVYNGEIYNYLDLRQRLESEGQTFKSSGDTAVMLRALGLHGPDAVSWLRGMFTFACWDPRQRRLLLARDPLGIKPLYVAPIVGPETPAGRCASPPSCAPCWPRACSARRVSTRSPSRVASGTASSSVPDTAVKGVELLSPGEPARVRRQRQGDPPARISGAIPERSLRPGHERGRAGRRYWRRG